jgi:predicted Zn-dependent protease with MMP-like domain
MGKFDASDGDLVKTKALLTNLPDLTDIYELAYKVLEELPKKFRAYTQNIMVRVENFADEQTLLSLNLDDKYDLLGLYRGIPLPLKNLTSIVAVPDTIFLYRCPLIRFSEENQENVDGLVHHVMIHEIGHHFGFSDFDMEWIERKPK